MSDFITELRREVVGGHATHRRRTARSTRMRRWRPALAGAAALAALLVVVVLAVRSVEAPEPAGEPRVVEVVRLGGFPIDGVFAGGSLWVISAEPSELLRIDPGTRRVVARIPVDGIVDDIAAGDGALWLRTAGTNDDGTRLSRIDLRSNRVVAGFDAAPGDALVVSGGVLWSDRRSAPIGVDRIDPGSGAVTGRVGFRHIDRLALAGDVLWAVAQNGTVASIDPASRRILHRWSQLAPSDAMAISSQAIAADPAGAWVLSTEKAAIFRLEGERVMRTLEIDSTAQAILAATADGLWIATGDELRSRFQVARLDPATGRETASVDVGPHRPRALIPVAGGLWVVAADGTAVLIET